MAWYSIYRELRRFRLRTDQPDSVATLYIRGEAADEEMADNISLHFDEGSLEGLREVLDCIEAGDEDVVWRADS